MIVAAAGAAAIALALLAWIGGELHYRNCLANAELRYPVAYEQPTSDRAAANRYFGIDPQARFVFHDRTNRNEAIASCSRWP